MFFIPVTTKTCYFRMLANSSSAQTFKNDRILPVRRNSPKENSLKLSRKQIICFLDAYIRCSCDKMMK